MPNATQTLLLLNILLASACLWRVWDSAQPAVKTKVSSPNGGQVMVYNTLTGCQNH